MRGARRRNAASTSLRLATDGPQDGAIEHERPGRRKPATRRLPCGRRGNARGSRQLGFAGGTPVFIWRMFLPANRGPLRRNMRQGGFRAITARSMGRRRERSSRRDADCDGRVRRRAVPRPRNPRDQPVCGRQRGRYGRPRRAQPGLATGRPADGDRDTARRRRRERLCDRRQGRCGRLHRRGQLVVDGLRSGHAPQAALRPGA